jgi:hypothetical protein
MCVLSPSLPEFIIARGDLTGCSGFLLRRCALLAHICSYLQTEKMTDEDKDLILAHGFFLLYPREPKPGDEPTVSGHPRAACKSGSQVIENKAEENYENL